MPVSAVALLPAFPLADAFFFTLFPFDEAVELDDLTTDDVFGRVVAGDSVVAAVVVVVVFVVVVVSAVVVVVVVVAVVSVKRPFRASALSASVNPSCCLVRTMEESRTGRSDVDGSGSSARSFQTSEAGSS